MKPKTILTGDRTTGPLHLGHYAGSLATRLDLQKTCSTYLLLADTQALTDNAHDPARIAPFVTEVALDYLAVGLDPKCATICLQSGLPALAELTLLYMNYVSVARLERNPTIKEECRARGFGGNIPAGFLCYPAAQAADITGFRADLVPVGADQLPIIEQTNEIVRRINAVADAELLPEAKALTSNTPRLPAPSGKGKMAKSCGHVIRLSASDGEISKAVRAMYTDPGHLRAEDPGQVEGNVAFAYLDAFDPKPLEVASLKERYSAGGLGDTVIKDRLEGVLHDLLAPIRECRAELARDPGFVREVIAKGTRKARRVTEETLQNLRRGLGQYAL